MASIQKRPDGKWRARYRDDDGREFSRHFRYKDNPRDPENSAQHWIDAQRVALRNGNHVGPDAGRLTLASFYADWSGRQVWADGTLRAFNVAMSGCTFADKPLGKLRRSDVESWVKLMSKSLAPGTVRTRFSNVHAVLRGAVRDRLIAFDPSEGVILPRQRRLEAAMAIPTPEQVGALMRAAEPWFMPFVAVCAFAGLRIAEASALKSTDIDFLRRRLSVRRQVQAVAGGPVAITPPKYGSERTVSIPDGLVEVMSVNMTETGVHGEEGWLFPGKNGLPPEPNSMRYHWRKTLAAASVHGFTPHDLRHFYASGLIAAGLDVVSVQKALGHAKPTTTLNTYSHLWPTAEDRTRGAAAELMRSAIDASGDNPKASVPRLDSAP